MATMTQEFRRHRKELSEHLTEALATHGDSFEVECDTISAYIAAHVDGGEASVLAGQLRQAFGQER
jgi:hypothetical protein